MTQEWLLSRFFQVGVMVFVLTLILGIPLAQTFPRAPYWWYGADLAAALTVTLLVMRIPLPKTPGDTLEAEGIVLAPFGFLLVSWHLILSYEVWTSCAYIGLMLYITLKFVRKALCALKASAVHTTDAFSFSYIKNTSRSYLGGV
jgi:hypothetical protein